MKEKVKQLCKDQGITLKDLAEKIGIARESLTRALDGNPTLSTLQSIASGLNVGICQLLESSDTSINGFVEYQGKVFKIRSAEDMENLIKMINKDDQ